VITTSEGQFFPEPGTDETLPVRVWAAAVDAEYVALKVSGHDESTSEFGNVTLESIHAPSSWSRALANPTKGARATSPLWRRMSHDTTVKRFGPL
jgi:hypothetical protein